MTNDQAPVQVAVLGLVILGSAIATAAAKRGMQVTGWDRSSGHAAALASAGIRAAGQGTRMKLLFNAWIAIVMEGVAEVAVLADALGIELQRFAGLVAGGPLVPPWALAKMKKIAEDRTADTEFPLRWADKDVHLALTAAGDKRARLPVLHTIDRCGRTRSTDSADTT